MYALLTPAEGPGLSPAALKIASVTATPATRAASPAGRPPSARTEAPPPPTPAAAATGEAANAVLAAASPAQRRLNFLLQASVFLSSKSPSLSRVLQQQLQDVARKHVLRLHASLKHSFCRSCFSFLTPENTIVRQSFRGRGCCDCSCDCLGGHARIARIRDVKAMKRETPEAPAHTASAHSSTQRKDTSGSTGNTSDSRGISWEKNASDSSCCSCSSCCTWCCSSDHDEGPWRQRRRRRRQDKAKGNDKEKRQDLPRQQPLMEVHCRVCGFVSRHP